MAKVLNTRMAIMIAAALVFTSGLVLTASADRHKDGDSDGKQCTMREDGSKQCEEGMKHKHGKDAMKSHAKHKAASADHLHKAMAKLDDAEDAIKNGKTKHAHKAIQEARKLVASAYQTVRPAVANEKCPIMGNTVKTDAVPANLYRTFKGKGVAFCCGGCPAAWDKLSDAKKVQKLASAGVTFSQANSKDVKFVAPETSDAAHAVGEALKSDSSCGAMRSCGSKK